MKTLALACLLAVGATASGGDWFHPDAEPEDGVAIMDDPASGAVPPVARRNFVQAGSGRAATPELVDRVRRWNDAVGFSRPEARYDVLFPKPQPMPCLLDQSVRAKIVADFRAWKAKRHPKDRVYLRLCCNDTGKWCECERCRALMTPERGLAGCASDYWWTFVNALAPEVLDDPLVSVDAFVYRNYQEFPLKVKPLRHPRLSVVLCPHGRCYTHSLNDAKCPKNGRYLAMFRQWIDCGMPINTFEYHNQTPGRCNYVFWERSWIEDVKWYARNGVSHGDGNFLGPWAGMRRQDNYYRNNAARARWQIAWLTAYFDRHPEADFDAVRNRLFAAYYRAAAKPMTAYRALLEKAFLESGICMEYGLGRNLMFVMASRPGLLREARRLLREAEGLAKGDAELERRVGWDREYFHDNLELCGFDCVEPCRTLSLPATLDDFRLCRGAGDVPMMREERYPKRTSVRVSREGAKLVFDMSGEPGGEFRIQYMTAKMNGVYRDVPAHYGRNEIDVGGRGIVRFNVARNEKGARKPFGSSSGYPWFIPDYWHYVQDSADVPLVVDGAAKAVVVLAADASESERFAAAELAKWTRELTGADMPVCASPRDGMTSVRFVRGDADVRHDGFSLTASPGEIVIAANKPIGMLFGVYYLLGRFGGIYWCHPDSGADFAPRRDLAVPAGRLVKTPMAVRQGIPSGNGALATPDRRERVALWNVRNGFTLNSRLRGADPAKTEPGNYYPNGLMARLGDDGSAETGGHVLGELVLESPVDPKELKESVEWTRAHADELFEGKASGARVNSYARWRVLVKRHPEWFGLVDGERVPTGVSLRQRTEIKGKSSMPCLSNPEVRELMLRNLLARRDRMFPGRDVTFRLCCDDQSQWCECDRCMKLLKCKGGCDDKDKASDYWWDFINWMSERLLADPTISLNVYVYRTYQTYPKRVKPIARERMRIILCPHGRCYLHSLTDPNCGANAKYREMFGQWAKEGMPILAFEYTNQTPGKCNYAFWERSWVEDLKWYAAHGISQGAGGLIGPWDAYSTDDGYFRRNAAKARWQIGWLTGHFEWDPDDDFDEVRDRLFSAYYRAAAKPMKAYREMLERALYATGQCMCYGSGGTLFSAAALQPGVLTGARRLLEESMDLAKGDAELERRIAADAEWFRTNWESAGMSGEAALEMTRAPAPPKLDGRLDEPFWRTTTAVDDFRKIVVIRDTPKKPDERYAPPTTLKFAFDDARLYVGCVCTKAGGRLVDIPADGTTFEAMRGSNVALYFMSPKLGGRYYHVVVSHNGKTYSALTENGRTRDLKKPLDFSFAVCDAADSWTLEMSVPLSALGGAKPGDIWKIDAARTAAGADGKIIRGYGSLCGYGQHSPEYWKTFSFGAPSNLLSNGSFEDLVPPPERKRGDAGLNGRGWTFLSEKIPAVWFWQQNGGIGEAVRGGAADGEVFLRLKSPKRGRQCFVWQDMLAYSGDAKALRFSFWARGRGQVTARAMQHPRQTERAVVKVDSTSWKRYLCEIPVDGQHPTRFMASVSSDSIDLDGFELALMR